MSAHIDEAEALLHRARDSYGNYPGNDHALVNVAAAQVHATLALAEAQREATAWGKQQVIQLREEQAQFTEDIKRILAEEHDH